MQKEVYQTKRSIHETTKNPKQKSNQYSLKTAQRQAFLQIFNMQAKNGKINRKDLDQIFERINYSISQAHFSQICDRAFRNKQLITFEQFMDTFNVKQSSFDMVDIKNAFRLIAGDQDTYIPVQKLQDLFKRQEIEQQRIADLFTILSTYIDDKNRFNYKMFLSHLN